MGLVLAPLTQPPSNKDTLDSVVVSSTSNNQQGGGDSSQFSRQSPSHSHQPSHPWSVRRLLLPPPMMLDNSVIIPPASPIPFPRYRPALPATATPNGDLFLFGGLMHETARNDLYLFSTRDLSATLLQTTGEIPPPRVGHASALSDNLLIVWGGDTTLDPSSNPMDRQDEALYLMNLISLEWTRISTYRPAPVGRYGHGVAMIGPKLFVFGGQLDDKFFNDLWAFDLASLQTEAVWELYDIAPDAPRPASRTGLTCIAYDNQLIVFGGTDGRYHYNDTWAFDLNTRKWSELECIGYIPSPREGHAATLVDDVMYISGGRAVDGMDLGDIAALNISCKRWYMFQNMGPSPSARSGHTMASVGARIFVLGGESYTSPEIDDPNFIHVLDTSSLLT